MAEVVGLIASTMTIAAVVIEGVRVVKSCYRASNELEILQGQVEQLSLLVEEIRYQDVASTSAVIATTLLKAKLALEKLNRLIQTKLTKNIHGTSRARRGVWARNKSKVKRIQTELQEHRSNLTAVMSALNTSSVVRSEAILESISHSISHSKQVSLNLDQHLLEIKQAVTRTHNPVLCQNATEHYPLPTISFNPAHHLTSLEQPTPSSLAYSQGHEMAAADFDSDPEREQLIPTRCTTGTTCPEEVPMKHYESSILGLVHKSSVYWAATKVSRKQVQIRQITTSSRNLQLPYSLQKRIHATLSRAEDCAEDSDLKCHIMNQDPLQVENDESYDNLSLSTNRLMSSCQNPMAFLNDLGCDQYVEDEVVQVEMLDPPGRFASCINGAMVYEVRLYDSKPTAELLYNIELLHRMKGTPGLARLVGIVTDTSRKYLQGYLIEFPRARWRLDRIALDPSVSWSRRRKWARQLIEIIAHLHSQGLVAGMTCAYRKPVILDDSDCVHFLYFRNTLAIGRKQGGYYPPEHQHLRKPLDDLRWRV
ncbi:MAG: hypothetical protein LQ342_006202 [Letrouitia transgressa]|nr:MAG: hypothetical protein LQ342_006202 [Letrouitia transgressa]